MRITYTIYIRYIIYYGCVFPKINRIQHGVILNLIYNVCNIMI